MARQGNEGGIGKKHGEKLPTGSHLHGSAINVKFYFVVFITIKRREKIMNT